MRSKVENRVLVVAGNLFVTLGLLAAIGPTLPEIARNTGSSLSEVGILFTALFVGAIPSQVLSGWLNDKYGPRPILGAGLLIMSAGLLGATLSPSLPLAVGFMLFGGFGDGALVVGANVMVAQTFAKKSAGMLNLMNVFYGIGAIAGPALVGLTLSLWQTSLPPLWFISLFMALIVIGVPGLPGRLTEKPEAKIDEGTGAQSPQTTPQKPFYLSPLLWIMSVLLLLYVGVEVGMGGWISAYMQRSARLSPETAALVASAFYVALTGGRLVGAIVGSKISGTQMLMANIALAVAGGLGMLVSVGNSLISILSIMLVGLALGPVYPTITAIVTQRFPAVAGLAASVVISAGSVGGMIIPWLLGVLIENQGAQSFAQAVAVGTLTMLALFSMATLVGKRRAQAREIAARAYRTAE